MSVFVAVADHGGFAAAARRLNLSPPSVTRAVSALEARLGARLFHRTTRSVRLTETGERYLADCRRILSDIEIADQQAAGLHLRPSGDVTVTASILFGHRVLASILTDLLDAYPEIAVTGLFSDRVIHMYEDDVDVAVRIANLPDSNLSAIRVGGVRTILCAAPEYLDARGRPKNPSELNDHALIDFPNLSRAGQWVFTNGTGEYAIKPTARLSADSGEVVLSAAVRGFGITRVLSYMAASDIATGRLEPVLEAYEPPPVPVSVVHKEAGRTAARVRAVVDFLVTALRNHPALD